MRKRRSVEREREREKVLSSNYQNLIMAAISKFPELQFDEGKIYYKGVSARQVKSVSDSSMSCSRCMTPGKMHRLTNTRDAVKDQEEAFFLTCKCSPKLL